jgi:hypothetical protein
MRLSLGNTGEDVVEALQRAIGGAELRPAQMRQTELPFSDRPVCLIHGAALDGEDEVRLLPVLGSREDFIRPDNELPDAVNLHKSKPRRRVS